MEQENENVKVGKIISDTTYQREKKEIKISTDDFDVVLDFFDKSKNCVNEIKKSDKMEEIHIWQVKFYIYVLESIGMKNVIGQIDYPKLKQKIEVNLSEDDRFKLKIIIEDIKKIVQQKYSPDVINMPFCKNCSYFELCYI